MDEKTVKESQIQPSNPTDTSTSSGNDGAYDSIADNGTSTGHTFLWADLSIKEESSASFPRRLLQSLKQHLQGWSLLRAICVTGALCLSFVVFIMMMVTGEIALVRTLWVCSMALLVVSQVTLTRAKTGLLSRLRIQWGDYLALAVILIVGAWLRFHRLGIIPDDIHGDIASQGMQARAIMQGQETRLFTVGWSEIPMFDFWQMAASMMIFGDNLFGMSMSAAIHGMLTLIGVFLLAQELFDRRVGFIATALLAISYNHIQFSRIVTSASPLTFMAFTFYFLARGLRGKGGLSFVLSGIFLGLGLQVYYPTRMMGVILLALCPWLVIWQRDVVRRTIGGWGLMVAGAFSAFGPFLAFGIINPSLLMGRGSVVTIFNPTVIAHLERKYSVSSFSGVLWENFKRTVLVFSAYGDTSTHFGLQRPFIDYITAGFMILGIAYSLRYICQARYGLLLVWLTGTLVLGNLISNDPPFWPHLIIVLIPVCILAALALERVWFVAGSLLGDVGNRLSGVIIAAALVFIGLGNWEVYYVHVRDNAQPLVRVGRIIDTLDPSVQVVLVDVPNAGDRLIEFFGYGHPVKVVSAAEITDPSQPKLVNSLIIIDPNSEPALEALRQGYPGMLTKQYRDMNNNLMFTSLRVGGGSAVVQLPMVGGGTQPSVTPLAQPAAGSWHPRYTFQGNTNSAPWDIDLGIVEIANGEFTLRVGALPGHDAAYDYLRLVAPDGGELRFEAEDPRFTTGDGSYANREGADGHWWLQAYGPFSESKGLIAQKDEGVPILTTTVAVPNGTYHLYIGSFYGDQGNGIFALGVDF